MSFLRKNLNHHNDLRILETLMRGSLSEHKINNHEKDPIPQDMKDRLQQIQEAKKWKEKELTSPSQETVVPQEVKEIPKDLPSEVKESPQEEIKKGKGKVKNLKTKKEEILPKEKKEETLPLKEEIVLPTENKEEPKQEIKIKPSHLQVNPKVLQQIKESHQAVYSSSEPKIIKPGQQFVELLDDILMEKKSSLLTKYRDIKKGEVGIFIRYIEDAEVGPGKEENSLLVEFNEPVFKSSLDQERNPKQFFIPKTKIRFLEDKVNPLNLAPKAYETEKVSLQDVIIVDHLHRVYKRYKQNLTALGILQYAKDFLSYILENRLEEVAHGFIEILFDRQDPSLLSPEGFLRLLDASPWIATSDLDQLFVDFINNKKTAKIWFINLINDQKTTLKS